jgi:hypothetical protein
MANSNGWGDGASNNNIGWGKGANNAIGWGAIHADSYAGLTDIVGVAPIPPFSGLLDTYSGASIAYSLRQLSSTYTGNCIRVRRSSDNAETNIGFVNNILDTASLLTFVGAGNGFVTTWYDQSGNGINPVQVAASQQPRIVNAGVIEVKNGQPAIRFIRTSSTTLIKTSYTSINFQNTTVATVVGDLQTAVTQNIFSLNVNPRWYTPLVLSGSTYYGFGATSTAILSEATDNNQRLYFMNGNATTISAFTNNITKSTVVSAIGNSSDILIGSAASTNHFNGMMQEAIGWSSEQSANRTGIQNNINSHYNIYP